MSNFNKVVLLHHNFYFGQSLPTYKGMDMDAISKELVILGFDVEMLSYQELALAEVKNDCIYLSGSHQNTDVKSYIDDILSVAFARKDNLVPSLELIKCHENKGVQGLLSKKLGLNYINQEYFVEVTPTSSRTVIKRISGAGSAGVSLVDSEPEVVRFLNRTILGEMRFKRLLYILRAFFRLKFSKWKFKNEYWEYYRPRARHIKQRFVEGLKGDYKVLVFDRKVFVLRRLNREGDFRASGSGNFEFVEPNQELLEFSLSFREQLNSPYVSLDLIDTSDGWSCIEFQCVHFGPYTQIEAPFYWEKDSFLNKWVKKENDTILESLISSSVASHIINKR